MSTIVTSPELAQADAPTAAEQPYSRVLFVSGLLARAWLWFVVGALAVTLLPILIGWRPYVVESGSMQPRIDVGDIVLAAPEQDPQVLLGRVAVFTDPARPENVKTHRVIAIAPDGTLVTKGDANPTPDPAPVPVADVRGLGRLLVSFAGLPLVWLQTGQWLALFGLLASLLAAGYAASRDREDGERDEVDDADETGPAAPAGAAGDAVGDTGDVVPLRGGIVRRWARLTGYGVALALALVVPTSQAAFSATTRSTANSWQVANVDYTSAVTALDPYLYWKLDETSTSTGGPGRTAADSSGNNRTGQYNTNGGSTYFTKSVTGALTTDTPNRAVTLNSASSCINTTSTTDIAAPAALTEIVWFRTTTTQGGKLLGFETPRTGVGAAGDGGTYDRHIYLDGSGRVWFGVYQGGDHLVTSPTALNDGTWHMAAATLGPTGMALYVDGVRVDTDSNTTGEASSGWFRAGCGNLAGWGDGWNGPNPPPASDRPTNYPFDGSLDEISVWTRALTAMEIGQLYFAR